MPTRELTPKEMKVAYDGPAFAANRCIISISPAGVRIAFTEQPDEDAPEFRTAVMLPFVDAISLKNVLIRVLSDIEKQQQQLTGTATVN